MSGVPRLIPRVRIQQHGRERDGLKYITLRWAPPGQERTSRTIGWVTEDEAEAKRAELEAMFRSGVSPTGGCQVPLPPLEGPAGWLYLIQGHCLYKIGFTRNSVDLRMKRLQTGSPVPLVMVASCRGTVADERALHARYASLHQYGEWFMVSPRIRDEFHALTTDPTRAP